MSPRARQLGSNREGGRDAHCPRTSRRRPRPNRINVRATPIVVRSAYLSRLHPRPSLGGTKRAENLPSILVNFKVPIVRMCHSHVKINLKQSHWPLYGFYMPASVRGSWIWSRANRNAAVRAVEFKGRA